MIAGMSVNYEKLGVFYLGQKFDITARQPQPDLLLYDSRDLVTHGLVVGMTGSGKTGLCVGLIEEAALDGIPALVIDPKGDLGNLLLTFPNLAPEDFAPWINPEDASRKGLSVEQFAATQAESWERGLAEWHQDKSRIQRLRDSAEFAIYTPGSSAGRRLSVLKSFNVPPPDVIEDGELLRERVTSTVAGLLGLAGINADPIKGRESIFLGNILQNAWARGQSLDLPGLIHEIQSPSMQKIGVLDLESFFPAQDRFDLSLQLNNLLASPAFSNWIEGEPLNIQQLLYTPEGKPRIAILSIAHLGDGERMLFVTLLLNELLGWMRTQSGTNSLRAILYMDEIMGYFPPVANPPSKAPLLTLLKQGRAFGIGALLATQNPVDLDYKGLGNIGTWFIGRLQTDRDKARLIEGLEGAAAGQGISFDRAGAEEILAGLGKRVFLMHNVHNEGFEIFESRWVMSYLRGPLSRAQIKSLMDRVPTPAAAPAPQSSAPAPAVPVRKSSTRPVLPPEIQQFFVRPSSTVEITFLPRVVGIAQVRFADSKTRIEHTETLLRYVEVTEGAFPVDWTRGESLALEVDTLENTPLPGDYAEAPSAAANPKNYAAWGREFADWIVSSHGLGLLHSPHFKVSSRPGESEGEFRIRLQQLSREERDNAVEELRRKHAPKVSALQERLRRAEAAHEREVEQAKRAKTDAFVGFGSSILGALLGRRKALSSTNVGRAARAVRGAGRAAEQSADIDRAQENVAVIQKQITDLEAQLQAEIASLSATYEKSAQHIDQTMLRPKKSQVTVRLVGLVWLPFRPLRAGLAEPIFAW